MGEAKEFNLFAGISTEELDKWWDEADDKGQSHGFTSGQLSAELGKRRQPTAEVLLPAISTKPTRRRSKVPFDPRDYSSGMIEITRYGERRWRSKQ